LKERAEIHTEKYTHTDIHRSQELTCELQPHTEMVCRIQLAILWSVGLHHRITMQLMSTTIHRVKRRLSDRHTRKEERCVGEYINDRGLSTPISATPNHHT